MIKCYSESNLVPSTRLSKEEMWRKMSWAKNQNDMLLKKYYNVMQQKYVVKKRYIQKKICTCEKDERPFLESRLLRKNNFTQTIACDLSSPGACGDVVEMKTRLREMRDTLACLEKNLAESDAEQRKQAKELRRLKLLNEKLICQLGFQVDIPKSARESDRMSGGTNKKREFARTSTGAKPKLTKFFKRHHGVPKMENKIQCEGCDAIKSEAKIKQLIQLRDNLNDEDEEKLVAQKDVLRQQIEDLMEMVTKRDETIFRLCEDFVTMRECKEKAESELNDLVNRHNQAIVKVLEQLNDTNRDLFVLSECLQKGESFPLSHFMEIVKMKVKRELENSFLTRERNGLLYEINNMQLENEELRIKLGEKEQPLHADEVNNLIEALKKEIKTYDDKNVENEESSEVEDDCKDNVVALEAGTEDCRKWRPNTYDNMAGLNEHNESRCQLKSPKISSRLNLCCNTQQTRQRDRSGCDLDRNGVMDSLKSNSKKVNSDVNKSCLIQRDNLLKPKSKDFFSWWRAMSEER